MQFVVFAGAFSERATLCQGHALALTLTLSLPVLDWVDTFLQELPIFARLFARLGQRPITCRPQPHLARTLVQAEAEHLRGRAAVADLQVETVSIGVIARPGLALIASCARRFDARLPTALPPFAVELLVYIWTSCRQPKVNDVGERLWRQAWSCSLVDELSAWVRQTLSPPRIRKPLMFKGFFISDSRRGSCFESRGCLMRDTDENYSFSAY